MKTSEVFAAGETVAQVFERGRDAEAAAARLRTAGFSDVRLSEYAGRTQAAHVMPEAGQTEEDFSRVLERAGFTTDRASQVTLAVAGGAVLLTVACGSRAADAAAVLRGEAVTAAPLGPVGDPVREPGAAAPAQPQAPPAATGLEPGDRVIALRGELLDVTTERKTHEARIRKELVTEQRTITVPVQREQLVVERDGEDDVRIPLSEPGR